MINVCFTHLNFSFSVTLRERYNEKNGAQRPDGEDMLFIPVGIEGHFPNTSGLITNDMLLCYSYKIVLFEYQGIK